MRDLTHPVGSRRCRSRAPRSRRMLQPFRELIARELPVTSRQAWARIRSGEPIGGDALLWVR